MSTAATTATLLVSSIVGSTNLWEQLPPAVCDALLRHDALVEGCITSHGGRVLQGRGSGSERLALFDDVAAAALAGCAVVQALLHEPFEGAAPLPRLAIHSAAATPDAAATAMGRRGAQLCRLAHPGQIVLSAAAGALLTPLLPAGLHIAPLGEYLLGDGPPEQLVGLLAAGLPDRFPPLPSSGYRRTNLPAAVTPLLGRTAELPMIESLLCQPTVRLLTLTGTGGVGKTRLALAAGQALLAAFPGGVFVVPLAAVSDATRLLGAVAQALGVPTGDGQPLPTLLAKGLAEAPTLLILNNFEHLPQAAPQVATLLALAPQVKVLATSRSRLDLPDEHELPIEPLPLPSLEPLPPLELVAEVPSVALFVARARAAKPAFVLSAENARAVAAICVWLDGLPLAIELAAARVKLLAPAALLERLRHGIALLSGGPRDSPARLQTLHATIAWSYDLLAPAEQLLFARLSVFVGGCTIAAVEAVLADLPEGTASLAALLAGLADQCLLTLQPSARAPQRLLLLHTLREFASEQLAVAGETALLRQRHAAYYLALAQAVAPERLLFDMLEADHDNLRAALDWALAHRDHATALGLAAALWRFWRSRGHLDEGRRRLDQVLAFVATTDASLPSGALLADALNGAGVLALSQGDHEAAEERLTAALTQARLVRDAAGAAYATAWLGQIAMEQGNHQQAQALLAKSLGFAEAANDAVGTARAANFLGSMAQREGHYERARQLYERGLALVQAQGDQRAGAAVLLNLGLVAHLTGDEARARVLYHQSLATYEQLGDSYGISAATTNLGWLALDTGEPLRARALFRNGLRAFEQLGDRRSLPECIEGLAGCAGALGNAALATRLFGAADTLRITLTLPLPPNEQSRYDALLATARTALPADHWQIAWAAGQALPIETLLDMALHQ